MFDFYLQFVGHYGMTILFAMGGVGAMYFVFAQIAYNRRAERARIANNIWSERRAYEARQAKRTGR